MFRTALGSVLLLVVVNVVATSAPPYDNSICMAHGDWTCLEQGTRICNWNRPTCGGSCYVCFGNDTIPPKMCFMNEGGQCQLSMITSVALIVSRTRPVSKRRMAVAGATRI